MATYIFTDLRVCYVAVGGVDLSRALPGILKTRGWTQDRLAAETGIRRTDINALARGRIRAGQDRLERIAAALEVSVLELGAPEGEADGQGRTLLDRLGALEAEAEQDRKRFDRFVRATTKRLAVLEAAREPRARRSGHPQ